MRVADHQHETVPEITGKISGKGRKDQHEDTGSIWWKDQRKVQGEVKAKSQWIDDEVKRRNDKGVKCIY